MNNRIWLTGSVPWRIIWDFDWSCFDLFSNWILISLALNNYFEEATVETPLILFFITICCTEDGVTVYIWLSFFRSWLETSSLAIIVSLTSSSFFLELPIENSWLSVVILFLWGVSKLCPLKESAGVETVQLGGGVEHSKFF